MLIEFAVKNYACFRDRQAISLVVPAKMASKKDIATGFVRAPYVSRVAAIFGANASGKSKFLEAFNFGSQFIVSPHDAFRDNQVPYRPFALSDEGHREPTEFSFIFVSDDQLFEYSFAVDAKEVVFESLVVTPKGGRRQQLISRTRSSELPTINKKIKGDRKVWAETVKPNRLLLTHIHNLKSEALSSAFSWFENSAFIRDMDELPEVFTGDVLSKPKFKKRILSLLKNFDLFVDDIEVKEIPLQLDDIPEEVMSHLKKVVAKEGGAGSFVTQRVRFGHRTSANKLAFFPLELESDGTRRLFAFAYPWLDILAKRLVVLIDEIDRSLHPLIVRFFVKQINSASSNKAQSQLIFTTHDISLLDEDVLDRHQIWLLDRGKSQDSRLFSLLDFKPRKGEALAKGYLAGRYGGIPILTEID